MVRAYANRLVHTIVPLEAGREVTAVGLNIMATVKDLTPQDARELGIQQGVAVQRPARARRGLNPTLGAWGSSDSIRSGRMSRP